MRYAYDGRLLLEFGKRLLQNVFKDGKKKKNFKCSLIYCYLLYNS